mmetsp:Transcript_52056/g.153552  ORF Transcript_52056/g.153552 Transcript_52056/m.153552 type:complete len:207 (-) Transcript_52056:695-1315(-)
MESAARHTACCTVELHVPLLQASSQAPAGSAKRSCACCSSAAGVQRRRRLSASSSSGPMLGDGGTLSEGTLGGPADCGLPVPKMKPSIGRVGWMGRPSPSYASAPASAWSLCSKAACSIRACPPACHICWWSIAVGAPFQAGVSSSHCTSGCRPTWAGILTKLCTAGDGGAEENVSLPSSLAAPQTSAAGCARSRKGRRQTAAETH